jgi:beta-glucosidase
LIKKIKQAKMKKIFSTSVVFLFIIIISFITTGFSQAQLSGYDKQIDSIISRMTLEEKIGQLNQFNGILNPNDNSILSNEQLNQVREGKIGSFLNVIGAELTRKIQKVAVSESRMKIPILFGYDVIHGFRATFPVPIAEASTWNPKLVEKSAKYQAIEASASGIHWTFSPMVDIARDPRWGRIVEGSGEDPYLGSIMASSRVKGYQGERLSDYNTIAACVKHYAAYGGAEGGRDYNTVDMSDRTLRDIYLKPYKATIDAGVATVMCSFNEIGGVPSSASYFLMTEVLRNEWKFDGFVVSDWNSIGELVNHGVARDMKHAAELGIKAGVDMDMTTAAYLNNLAELVKEGKVTETLIDESVKRILKVKFELGLFADPYLYCDTEREKKTILSKEVVDATKEVSLESVVLLKNENNLLPLNKNLNTIAVIGPLADSQTEPLGAWSAQGKPEDVVSLLEGIKNKVSDDMKVLYAKGCEINDDSKEGFEEAIETAKKSDIVILALGEAELMSGESHNRSSLDLPGVQNKLAKAIYETGKPVVVVLMNGRPLSINWISENIPAILETWFLGIQTGNAIADILFGDYNPDGKLPVTFPRTVGQIPIYYNYKNTGRPADVNNGFTSKYLDLPITPLYPFGYGLSYTTFLYSNLKIEKNKISSNKDLTVTVDVENTGKRPGKEVVQLYIRDLVGSVTRPVKELKGFEKISLEPGEKKNVKFIISPNDLAFYDINMNYTVEPGDFKVFVGGNSVDVLEADFEIIE